MSQVKTKLQQVDPVWTRICEEARDAVAQEPLMGALVHGGVLQHDSFEDALGYRLAMKLASPEMSAQSLRDIVEMAFADDASLPQKARADLVANGGT